MNTNSQKMVNLVKNLLNKKKGNNKMPNQQQIKTVLPLLKANRYTYYNLMQSEKDRFQKNYNWLKKYSHIWVANWHIKYVTETILKRRNLDYCNKLEAINYLSCAI